MSTIFPEAYRSTMGVIETEIAIKKVKDYFEKALSQRLSLIRVSAPLFVYPETGLNDNLNGIERPVSFEIGEQNERICEVVQSLAKWKRNALNKYGFLVGTGLYTDMNAIRRDEFTDNLHSLYVDQWDWEKVISRNDRTVETLKTTVTEIYNAFLDTANYIETQYPDIPCAFPEKLTFLTAAELEQRYPKLEAKDREHIAAKEFGAIFIIGIGGKLPSGEIHDGRAPDYDDWNLNGDLIVDYPLLNRSVELSSMGIRVDKESLLNQVKEKNAESILQNEYCKDILSENLPLTMGGGIGQSRLCMLLLKKAHVGEVQASVWPDDTKKMLESKDIILL